MCNKRISKRLTNVGRFVINVRQLDPQCMFQGVDDPNYALWKSRFEEIILNTPKTPEMVDGFFTCQVFPILQMFWTSRKRYKNKCWNLSPLIHAHTTHARCPSSRPTRKFTNMSGSCHTFNRSSCHGLRSRSFLHAFGILNLSWTGYVHQALLLQMFGATVVQRRCSPLHLQRVACDKLVFHIIRCSKFGDRVQRCRFVNKRRLEGCFLAHRTVSFFENRERQN